MSPLRGISIVVAGAVLATSFTAAPAASAETPFEQRYQVDQRGGAVRAANSIVTCKIGLSATAPACGDARKGANVSNNSYAFEFIDVDDDPATFDSSSADLTVPATATVSYAQLYWGANLRTTRDTPGQPAGNRAAPDASKKNQVKLKVPGGAYQDITADAVYDLAIGSDPAYQARADVTSAVKAAGAGIYTLADIQAARGSSNLGAFGGWTLVVAYEDANESLRNITIYDGLRLMERFQEPITVDLTGFTTPATGSVKALLGAVTYDGDKSGSGDRMSIKTTNGPLTDVSDAENPASNVFNSTISTEGADTTDRDPAYKNTLGYDSDVFDVSKAFRNNDKSLKVTLSTNNENYAPGVIFMQIDLYEAHAVLDKKVSVVGEGSAEVGSTLEYTMTVESDGDDAAAKVAVSDTIPANTTYVPGSLKINGTGRTDATGDDQADSDAGTVAFRLGTGANATSGGELKKGQSATMTFRVTVDPAAQGTQVDNTATVSYESKTLGTPYTADANVKTPVRSYADVSLKKTGPATAKPGDFVIYTITVKNNGPDTARAVTVQDEFAAGLPTAGGKAAVCTETPGKVTCDLGDLASGAEQTFNVRHRVPADAPPGARYKDTATVSTTTLDPNKDNDTDHVTTTVIYEADLEVTKTGHAELQAGKTIEFSITGRNNGPSPANEGRLADLVPAKFTKVTWTCTATKGKCLTPSGTGNDINVIVDLPVEGEVTVRIQASTPAGGAGTTLCNSVRGIPPESVTETKPETNHSRACVKLTPKRKPHPKPKPKPKPKPRPPHDACRGCFPV